MPRLSTLVDKNLFIADNGGTKSPGRASLGEKRKIDELTESPQHVVPYPPRPRPKVSVTIGSPAQRHVEGVYDRYVNNSASDSLASYSYVV